MKSLLIYNKNIAPQLAIEFEAKLGKTYNFQVGKQELLNPNFTMDSKMNYILKNEIENCRYDAIFIPYSLSDENYLEFSGLRLAYHIRLTPQFDNMQTPIVFFGYETLLEVNKLSKLGSILFSKGCFHIDRISIESFEEQILEIKEKYSEMDIAEFLNDFIERNALKPAGNYTTHHSITNEWSIYRWTKSLNLPTENIDKEIKSNLYFKYLKAKYPIKKIPSAKRMLIQESGKILYLDDEIDKGWATLFKTICIGKTFNSIGADFKNLNSDEIIEHALEKVNSFGPDVVLLDFRLHDDDFEVSKPEDVTGFKILQEIKKVNKGIQVVILSATNKIWNLLELQKAGADEFILKESPELSTDENYSVTSINNIYFVLNEKLKAGKFLKFIDSSFKKIIGLITINNPEEDFKEGILNNFEIAFKLLHDSFFDEKYRNYAYLQLFLIIEEWLKQPNIFLDESDNCYVAKEGSSDEKYLVRKNVRENEYECAIKFDNGHYSLGKETKHQKTKFVDTNFKMSSVLLFKYGCSTSGEHNWTSIYKVRNQKAAHPERKLVEKSEIESLLQFMEYIFNQDNINEIDISNALPEDSYEKKAKLLKQKYSK